MEDFKFFLIRFRINDIHLKCFCFKFDKQVTLHRQNLIFILKCSIATSKNFFFHFGIILLTDIAVYQASDESHFCISKFGDFAKLQLHYRLRQFFRNLKVARTIFTFTNFLTRFQLQQNIKIQEY